jgi:hypothetical protein
MMQLLVLLRRLPVVLLGRRAISLFVGNHASSLVI